MSISDHDIPPADRFIDDREAAQILGLSRSYLRQLRVKGGGAPYSKFNTAVRYRISDLLAWAASCSTRSTSESTSNSDSGVVA